MESEDKTTRPGFFDDDDLTITFHFNKPEKTHQKDLQQPPVFKSALLKKVPGSATQMEGFYALHNRTLACYKNSSSKAPESVLDINFAKLAILTPTETDLKYGFSVSKNESTYNFYTNEKQVFEDWVEVLKDMCILGTFHDDFKALKMIGRGSFAKVYLVESKATGKMYAVKAFTKEGIVISNKNNAKPSMLNEIDIMKSLDHENIIKLHEVHETENSIYLVLELIQGRSLQDAVKKNTFREEYSEVKVINMVRSILDALAYQASKGIMHRDLKPDNILLDKESKIKIADFGLATLVDLPEYIFKKCGTPGYIAPEVFSYDPKESTSNYDHKCDVFSAGCIMYYMIFGYPFFEGANGSEILRLNRKFTSDFDSIFAIKQEIKNPTGKIPKDALSLLLQLLEIDPKKRISAEEALCHPYFIPVPNGMLKVAGSNDLISNPLSKEAASPKLSSRIPFARADSIKSPGIQSPILQAQSKGRFTNKNSFYLDMGKPELNGKIDTISNGSSNNNSVLLKRNDSNASIGSGPDSPSAFGKQNSMLKRSRSLKAHNPMASNGQSILKAAIFRNMQKNNEANEEGKDDEGTDRRASDRHFDFTSSVRSASKSPDSHSESSESSPQNSPHSIDKARTPGRTPQSSKRRFQPFAQKSVSKGTK